MHYWNIGKDNAQPLMDDLMDTIKAWAKSRGLVVYEDGYQYEDYTLKPRLVLRCEGDEQPGKPFDFDSKALQAHVPVDCWHKPFIYKGEIYIVRDIDTSKRKMPVRTTRAHDGEVYWFKPEVIRDELARMGRAA